MNETLEGRERKKEKSSAANRGRVNASAIIVLRDVGSCLDVSAESSAGTSRLGWMFGEGRALVSDWITGAG